MRVNDYEKHTNLVTTALAFTVVSFVNIIVWLAMVAGILITIGAPLWLWIVYALYFVSSILVTYLGNYLRSTLTQDKF